MAAGHMAFTARWSVPFASLLLVIFLAVNIDCYAQAARRRSYEAEEDTHYFSCKGKSGIADHQEKIPLLNKEIISNQSKVKGSVSINNDSVVINGIPFATGSYSICGNSDQVIWFSVSGSKDYCAGNDMFNDLGVFNKINGDVRYHVGDFVSILSCKKAKKLVK